MQKQKKEKISSGSMQQLVQNNPQYEGWVAGTFVESDSFFHTDEVEIKWAVHKKGDVKPGLKTKTNAKTITLLIEGKFTVSFPNEDKEIVLSSPGEYVAYDAAEVDHIGEAQEESVVLVIRWPSKR